MSSAVPPYEKNGSEMPVAGSRFVTTPMLDVYKRQGLHDAYLSVVESLFHAGTALGAQVEIEWVESETLTPDTAADILSGCAGVLIPGGFGDRGIEGIDRKSTRLNSSH